MTENELHNQELIQHEKRVDRNVERQQAINLDEQKRDIAVGNQNSTVARIVNLTYFLIGALGLLLAMRVSLYVIGANMDNSFARFIDDLSSPFVTGFADLLKNPTLGSTGVLEVTTLIAMLVYAIGAWLVSRLIWLTLSRSH